METPLEEFIKEFLTELLNGLLHKTPEEKITNLKTQKLEKILVEILRELSYK